MGVNQSIPKVDAMGLLLGKPAYTDDLAPRDALIVKVLRSPYAHAKIVSIDTKAAKSMPEIKCVLTYENVPDVVFSRAGQGFPEPSPYDARILERVMRYIGDAVAVVAGTNERIVDLAISKINVEYEVLPAILDFEEALDSEILIHADGASSSMFPIGHDASRNLAAAYAMEIGEVEAVMKTCDYVHKATYRTQAQSHAMSEPHATVTYYDTMDRLTVISTTQTPFHVRRILAKNLNIPLSSIRVIKPRIGGGYGGKQAIHGEFYTALVTKLTGLPAKLIYNRKEVFTSTYTRHQMKIEMTMGAMKDGTIRAIDVKVLSNTGAYGEHALTVLMIVGSKTLPLYNKVEAVGFKGDVVYTNLTPAGAFRGYGAVQGNFALESMIDEMAHLIGINPIDFRKKNMICEGETSKIFEVMGEGTEGTAMVIESCKLEQCMDDVIERSGLRLGTRTQTPNPRVVIGKGMAIAMQGSGIPYFDMASAIIKLNDGGFFNLLVGATDLGTGSDTILSQIAAEALGVTDDKIIVYSSDTDLTPFDTGAYASSTTYVSGHSVRIAAQKMKAMIEEKAKTFFGAEDANDAVFDGKFVSVGENTMSIEDFSTKLFYSEHQEQLVASGSYVGIKSPPPYMASVCEVEVDTGTGSVKVLNYYSAVDCGVAINPNLAKVQVEGAMMQGIGMTLYEDAKRTPKGKLINDSFLRYKVPTRMDVGSLTVTLVESYEPSGPYGAKSVGEIGIDTPPAAIANAIFNATGVRIRTLPITSEAVWRALTHESLCQPPRLTL